MPGAKATAPRLQDVRRIAFAVLTAAACSTLAGCSTKQAAAPALNLTATTQVAAQTDEAKSGEGTDGKGSRPYRVAGSASAIESFEGYSAEGLSSWYGTFFHGRTTANGEVFDKTQLSAAHPSMPLPSYARVTNTSNGKSVVVRVNDRGPFHGNRALDVSEGAADLLGFKNHGMARVRIDYVGPASLQGSDNEQLMASYRENGHAPAGVMLASVSHPAAQPESGPTPAAMGLRSSAPSASAPPPVSPAVQAASATVPPKPISAPQASKPEPAATQTAATTPVDVASRIQASFGSMNTPPPVQGRERPQMVQPVLSGFAFEPSTFTAPR